MVRNRSKLKSSSKILWLLSGVSLILALLLINSRDSLKEALEDVREEYELGLALSDQEQDYESVYRKAIEMTQLPSRGRFSQNTWIQDVQHLVSGEQLSLQELKPIYQRSKKGKRSMLHVVVEGRVADLLKLMYRFYEQDSYVYIKQITMTTADDADRIWAQMTLSQH